MDAVLGTVLATRGRDLLATTVGGCIAFWCLGVIAIADLPRLVAVPARCADPDAKTWCIVADSAGLVLAALLVLGALGVITSAAVVVALTEPVLVLVSGDGWPRGGWAGRFTTWCRSGQARQRHRLVERADAGESRAAVALAWYPTGERLLRPTRAGNAFASLAQRVGRRHGLELSTCWGLFEEVLDESTRGRVETASSALTRRINNLLWAVAALLWVPALPTWMAFGLGGAVLLLVVLLWVGMTTAAQRYCRVVEAAIMMHRRSLYEAVGWPLPASTSTEPDEGRTLTAYIDRMGLVDEVVLQWPVSS